MVLMKLQSKSQLPEKDANAQNNYILQNAQNHRNFNKTVWKLMLLVHIRLINFHFNRMMILILHRKFV